MTKIFNLTDDNFYKLLNSESYLHFKSVKDAISNGSVPYVKITSKGHISSWYNKHIDKSYEIYKFVINTENNYINFIVKSKEDGSKNGYKPQFSSMSFGKGFDIVHGACCEILIAISK